MNNTEQGKTPKAQPENDNDNKKAKDQQIKSIVRANEFEFRHAVVRVAILQICQSTGFKSFQNSALSTLAEIATRYICQLGKSAHIYSNLAGRTDSTALDVIHALEDMNRPQGFVGASDFINHRISASQTVREIANYLRRAKKISFAWPEMESRFPAVVERRLETATISATKTEASPWRHIPPWLPPFPNPSGDLNPKASFFSTRVSLFEAFAPSKQESDREPVEVVVAKGLKRKSQNLATERTTVQFKIGTKNSASICHLKSRADKIVKASIENI